MINALKLVSINRGYDPRDFAMVAFGGGGAMHATALARELNIPKVIIPAHSAVFSAWGMLVSDLRRDYIRTHPLRLSAAATQAIGATFAAMEDEALQAFLADRIAKETIYYERYLDLRYEGQEHSVRIPVPCVTITDDILREIIVRFHDAYEREYTYRLDNAVELVTFHLVAFARVDRPDLARLPSDNSADDAVKGRRAVDFDTDGICDTVIYDRSRLDAQVTFKGPAIIEEAGSTTVVFPGQTVRVDDYGNLHITIEE
jgi:N-methylhydantoinase A